MCHGQHAVRLCGVSVGTRGHGGAACSFTPPVNVVAGRYGPEMPREPNDDVSTRPGRVQDRDALARARGEHWLPDPLLAYVAEAGTFIDRVGFAFLFPPERV